MHLTIHPTCIDIGSYIDGGLAVLIQEAISTEGACIDIAGYIGTAILSYWPSRSIWGWVVLEQTLAENSIGLGPKASKFNLQELWAVSEPRQLYWYSLPILVQDDVSVQSAISIELAVSI